MWRSANAPPICGTRARFARSCRSPRSHGARPRTARSRRSSPRPSGGDTGQRPPSTSRSPRRSHRPRRTSCGGRACRRPRPSRPRHPIRKRDAAPQDTREQAGDSRTPAEQPGPDPRERARRVLQIAVREDARADDRDARVLLRAPEHPPGGTGGEHHVRVHRQDVLPARQARRGCTPRRSRCWSTADRPGSPRARASPAAASVRGTVVDDDDLVGRTLLTPQRLHRGQRLPGCPTVDDDPRQHRPTLPRATRAVLGVSCRSRTRSQTPPP
jgi:hypothetical protein